jgi:hypothetical protein
MRSRLPVAAKTAFPNRGEILGTRYADCRSSIGQKTNIHPGKLRFNEQLDKPLTLNKTA